MARDTKPSPENPGTEEESRFEKLFEAAHRDEVLKKRLFSNPREVAKEWNIELGDREVERLTKLGAFAELAHEARFGRLFPVCDPRVCYPSTVWLKQELIRLIEDVIIIDKIRWVLYPVDPNLRFGLRDQRTRF